MSDFRIQYVQGTLASGSLTKTVSAPADFDPVSSLSRAFILQATTWPTVGLGNAAGAPMYRWTASATLDAVDTITIERFNSTGDTDYAFWIIEYTGDAGGPNEFIVRGRGEVAFPTGITTVDTPAIAGISGLSKCVPFINGRHDFSTADARYFLAEARVYNNGTSDVIGLERRITVNGEPTYAYQCVEFTGIWWSVQSGLMTQFQTDGAVKDQLISALLGTNKAWVFGYFNPSNSGSPEATQWWAWLSSITNLRMRVAKTGSQARLRWYVIQSIAPTFNVEQHNVPDGVNDFIAGASPQIESTPLNARVRLKDSFVTGMAGSNNADGFNHPCGNWRFRLSNEENAEARRLISIGDTEYVVQVVQLAGDSLPPTARHLHNTLLRM